MMNNLIRMAFSELQDRIDWMLGEVAHDLRLRQMIIPHDHESRLSILVDGTKSKEVFHATGWYEQSVEAWYSLDFRCTGLKEAFTTDDLGIPFVLAGQLVDGPGLVYRRGEWLFISYSRYELLHNSSIELSSKDYRAYLGKIGRRRLEHLYRCVGKQRLSKSWFFEVSDKEFLIDLLQDSAESTGKIKRLLSYCRQGNCLYTKSVLHLSRIIETGLLYAHCRMNSKPAMKINTFRLDALLAQLRRYIKEEKNPFYSYNIRNILTFYGYQGINRNAKFYELRMFHPSQYGFIAPFQTPESESIGMVCERAQGALLKDDLLWNTFTLPGGAEKLISIDDIVEGGFAVDWDGVFVSGSPFHPETYPEYFSAGGSLNIALSDPCTAYSYLTLLIPYANHTDASRLLMATKNMKQVLPIVHGNEPLVQTENYQNFKRSCQTFFRGHCYGVNLLTGYLSWKGYNFEDGLVISRKAATRLTSVHESRIPIPARNGYSLSTALEEHILFTLRGMSQEEASHLYEQMGVLKGRFLVNKHIDGVTVRRHAGSNCRVTALVKLPENVTYPLRSREYVFSLPKNQEFNYAVCISYVSEAEVGDKLIGRHANKGVVAKILDDDEMPRTKDGRVLEMLINPMSVISRMNISQLFETESVLYDEKPLVIPFFTYAEEIELKEQTEVTCDGTHWIKTAVGHQFFFKLDHCAEDKAYFVKQARKNYLDVHLKGKRNLGGMRLGEMEFWALQAHGAYRLIHTMLNRLCASRNRTIPQTSLAYAWYLLMLGYQLECSSDGEQFMPFYQYVETQAETVSGWKFSRLENLRSLEQYYGDSFREIKTLTQLVNHSNSQSPAWIQLKTPEAVKVPRPSIVIPAGTQDSQISGVLVIPGTFLLMENNGLICDPVTKNLYKVLLSSKKEYPMKQTGRKLFRGLFTLHNDRIIKDEGAAALIRFISGKKGIIRSMVLARRFSHSGRAVIVPEPRLELDEISLPDVFSHDLRFCDEVLALRYPSLFRFNVMRFRQNRKVSSRYVIKINPLICAMIAGDFDGDTMSWFAHPELFLDEHTQFSPANNVISDNGKPMLHLEQDLIYGYALLKEDGGDSFFSRIGYTDLIPLFDNTASLEDFVLEIFRFYNDSRAFAPCIKEVAQALFEYTTMHQRASTMSLHQLKPPKDVSLDAYISSCKDPAMFMVHTGARGKMSNLVQIMKQASGHVYLSSFPSDKQSFLMRDSLIQGLSPLALAFFSCAARSGLGEKKLATPDGGEFNRRLNTLLYELVITGQPASVDACSVSIPVDLVSRTASLAQDMKLPQTEPSRKEISGFLQFRTIMDTKTGNVVATDEAVDGILRGSRAYAATTPLSWSGEQTQAVDAACIGTRFPGIQTWYTPGARIGLIAAQAIGEQATQLAMKSFQGNRLLPLDMVKTLVNLAAERLDDLFPFSLLIYMLYSMKVRAEFIELLLKRVCTSDKGLFLVDSFQKVPWADALFNTWFGYFRNNLGLLDQEIEKDKKYSLRDSFQYRFFFNDFLGEIYETDN